MKRLKTIAKELTEILKPSNHFVNNTGNWVFYCTIMGHYNNKYYDICLSKYKNNNKEIEIAHTTKDPKEILEMIKEIEPKAKVTYTQTTYKEVTE